MHHRTRVKFCGITRALDAQLAVEFGADALGFVFHPQSPRYIEPQLASKIIARLPPFVACVGLVVNRSLGEIEEIIAHTQVDLIQFHGDERPQFCEQVSRPYIKAIRVKDNIDVREMSAPHDAARGILLDAFIPGIPGGSGESFDWTQVPRDIGQPLIVAGGLNVDNVASAIEYFRPFAVDVSSGIEASHGIKDAVKMKRFIATVKQADGLVHRQTDGRIDGQTDD